MWDNASEDVRRTYGRDYLDDMIDAQEKRIKGSALTTKPVIDALEDALVSDRPQTRYLVDGGDGWLDIGTVSCLSFVSKWRNMSRNLLL